MAVVKRATVKLLGSEFRKVYNFDAKSGKFWMLLPGVVRQELNLDYMRISSASVEDLDKQLASLVQQVKDKKTVVTKVIAINAKLTATIYGNGEDEDGNRRIVIQSREVSFADGLAVSLAVGVYNETKTSLENGFTLKYAYQESTIPESFRDDRGCENAVVVPWTQQLETEIAEYCVKLEDMALKAKELQESVINRG